MVEARENMLTHPSIMAEALIDWRAGLDTHQVEASLSIVCESLLLIRDYLREKGD